MLAALVFLGLDFLFLGGFGGVGLFLDLLPFSGVVEFVLDWVQQTTEGRVDSRFELFVISIGLVAIELVRGGGLYIVYQLRSELLQLANMALSLYR